MGLDLRKITVSRNAIRQAKTSGLTGDVESRLKGLYAFSAPVDLEVGNAAYGPFVMLVRGNTILSFTRTGPQEVDERDVSECKLCAGLMVRVKQETLNGQVGRVARPCPRALNPDAPLCDTLVKRNPR